MAEAGRLREAEELIAQMLMCMCPPNERYDNCPVYIKARAFIHGEVRAVLVQKEAR